jgi:PAS domain S-box-containing protein
MDLADRRMPWIGAVAAAVERREASLALFVEHVPAALAMFDTYMRYMLVSRRWLTQFGIEREHVIGRSHYEVLPGTSPRWRDIYARALSGQIVEGEEDQVQDAQGATQWLRWEVRPWRQDDGAIGGLLVFCEDITERKRAELELRASAERLRVLADTAPVMMWMSAADGGFIHVNQVWLDFSGRPRSAELGLGWTDAVHPDDRDACVATHCAGVAAQKVVVMDYRLCRADGQYRWISHTGIPRFAPGGQFLGYIGSSVDVTERKLAADEKQRLADELDRRVRERTHELEGANHELEAFAYAVSHDLRAPLRAMHGFSRALVEDYGERFQDEAGQYLEQIQKGAQHMSELIDGLLVLSRVTRGELERDPVDLSEYAREILRDLVLKEPERQVVWEVEPGLTARGDPRMLEVVLRNLLANAMKYTARKPETRIRFAAELHEGERCFCVSDNGAGFDMAHAAKLFQPFQRLHRADEFPGLGVGLATVQRIVHRHGGRIWATATPGEGATFRFTLPSVEQERP